MEEWRQIREFPSHEVSNEGRVKNIRTQHILKPCPTEEGYMRVTIMVNGSHYTRFIHRLVADTFIGECPGMVVRHRDNDPSNNRVGNLYLATRKDTIEDSYSRGRMRSHNNRWIQVVETGRIYDSISSCAYDIGCDKSHIHKYLAGRCSHVKGYHFLTSSIQR